MSSGTRRQITLSAEHDHERQIADLTRRVEALEQLVRRSTPRDPIADTQLLSTLAMVYGESVFSARDLVQANDLELQSVLGGANRRQIGAWLRRLHREPHGGPYVLRRVGRDETGAVWTLAVCDPSTYSA